MKDLIQIMEKNPNVTYKSIPDIIWEQFDQVLKKMTKNNKCFNFYVNAIVSQLQIQDRIGLSDQTLGNSFEKCK